MTARPRFFAAAILASAATLIAPCASHAQSYPSKTIRMIIPIAPGGGTDGMGRLISQRLSEQLGVTIVADNRAGAGTSRNYTYSFWMCQDGPRATLVACQIAENPREFSQM